MKHTLLSFFASLFFLSANAGIGFTPNLGQYADQNGTPAEQVLFRSVGTGPSIFVTTSGLTYMFLHRDEQHVMDPEENPAAPVQWSAIHMELAGAVIRPENVIMENALPGVSNFYYPHCREGIVGVQSFHKITIKEIYPGIDWVITADDVNGVAHDFVVHPNGNHQSIVMRYSGLTAPITMNEKFQLVLQSQFGTMYEGGLKVYAQDNMQPLQAFFNLNDNEVSFIVVRRRGECGLIIDPPLQWNSLQASSGFDYGAAVAAAKDGSGDVMGAGFTDGSDYPVMNATQGTLSGPEDAVIYRLDALGNRLWSTYFGGTDYDQCKGIATDLVGNCYVTGYTNSQDLPVMNSLQQFYGGGVYDAFIAKYNAQGVMQWASWRGGTGADFGTAIASDDAGTLYVVGYTNTTVNFPLLNAVQATNGGVYDGFVMRLDASQVMQWSTYYGGTDEDKFRAVALDPLANNIVIAGNAMSGNFPTAGNPFQLYNAQAWFTSDAVIVKMTVNQSVVFASYCGGDEDDFATGITVDDAGNIYATGYTTSGDFPKVDQGGTSYSDTTLNAIGTQDAFVVKCNPAGTTLLWSTYFGGTASDYGFGIAYDQFVGVYVCGNTASTDFPVMMPADMNYYQSTHGDGGSFNDMWIAWFDTADSLVWSTYYGNSMSNDAYGVSVGLQNEIFMTGVDSNEIAMVKFNPGVPTTAAMQTESGMELLLGPNPAWSQLTIQFSSPAQGNSVIEIMDTRGRIVQTEYFGTSAGINRYEIDIAGLAGGLYSIRITAPDQVFAERFVKGGVYR